MSVPIICLGCNERAEIPFIPPDLTCVACKTGEHIDLDDLSVEAASQTCPECGGSGQCDVCGGTGKFDPEKSVDRSMGKGAMLDDLPMMLLPSGVPDEDRDMPLLDEDGTKRKVTVPKGSAPYSQQALASQRTAAERCPATKRIPGEKADSGYGYKEDRYTRCTKDKGHAKGECSFDSGKSMPAPTASRLDPSQGSLTRTADLGGIRNLLAQFNGKNVTVTYDDDLGLHTVAGPLVYHPPAVMVGKSATTDAHVLQITVNGYGDWPDERTESTGSPSLLDYAHIGPSAMASKTAGDVVPFRSRQQWDGWTQRHCSECGDLKMCNKQGICESCFGSSGMTANPQRTKVAVIADAVQESNPGMDRKAALRVARLTVQRYPKVAG